jgi:hypothetical protein
MSRYSDDERAAILEAARRNIKNGDEELKDEPLVNPLTERRRDPGDGEDALERWRRLRQRSEELPREKRPLVYKSYAPAPTQKMDAETSAAWNAWVDERIAAAIAQERAFVMEVMGQSLGEHVARVAKGVHKDFEEAVRQVRLEIAQTRSSLDVLIKTFRADAAKLIDAADGPSVIKQRIN